MYYLLIFIVIILFLVLFFTWRYYSKKNEFLAQQLLKRDQELFEFKHALDQEKSLRREYLLQSENLKIQLTEKSDDLLGKEKEIKSLYMLIEDLKQKNKKEEDDIIVEYFAEKTKSKESRD